MSQELMRALAAEEGSPTGAFTRYADLARNNMRFQPVVAALALLGPPVANLLLWKFHDRSPSEWIFLLVFAGYLPGAAAAVTASKSRFAENRQSRAPIGLTLFYLAVLHFVGFLIMSPLLVVSRRAYPSETALLVALSVHMALIYLAVYPLADRRTREEIDGIAGDATQENRWGPARPFRRVIAIASDLAVLVRLGPRRIAFAYGAAAAALSEIGAFHRDASLVFVLSCVAGLLFAIASVRDDADPHLAVQARLGLARAHLRLRHFARARFFANDVLDTAWARLPPRAEAAALLLLIEHLREPFRGFENRFGRLVDYVLKAGTVAESLSAQQTRELAGTDAAHGYAVM
ncbi:MAG: hypothetical protein ACXW4P_12680 [Thermoanaerobaculia bacterium]